VSVRGVNELIGAVQGTPEALGLRVDDLVYGCGVTGRDRRSGDYAADVPGQADRALDTVDAQLRELGGSLDELARVTFYLREPGDIRKVNDVWTARFPDEREALSHSAMEAYASDCCESSTHRR